MYQNIKKLHSNLRKKTIALLDKLNPLPLTSKLDTLS